MIYQPRNIQPSYISIDGTENNAFTMEVNTNNYISAYELTILNWDNTIAYQGDKTYTSSPVYNEETLVIAVPSSIGLENGYNYKWYTRLYQPTSDMLITYGIAQNDSLNNMTVYVQTNINIKEEMNITIHGETKKISSYDEATGIITLENGLASPAMLGDEYQIYSNFIQTTPEYILYVRETPRVEITNYSASLDKKYKNFLGSYNQSDNVPITYHQWDLYLVNNNGSTSLLKTSGKVYNADIQFYYDGFKNGQTYQIILSVETEYGVIATSGTQTFTVSYTAIEYLQQPSALVISDKNAVQVDWVAPVSFSPSVTDELIAEGYIQPGEITNNSLYLKPNQGLIPGQSFSTGLLIDDTILTYDNITGYTTFLFGNISDVLVGDYYTISGHVEGMDKITILKDNPYLRSNSAELGNCILQYRNEDNVNPIGILPDEYNITMQFKPDLNFFYGTSGIYNDMIIISSFVIDKNPDDNAGTISLYAHRYNIVALKSETDNEGEVVEKIFPEPPEGENNTATQIYLAEDIDLSKQSYILLNNYDYIEYISEFDPITKIATLGKPLPDEVIPTPGETYIMQDTLATPFYSNVNNTFVLQNSNVSIASNDYVWLDDGYIWNDDYYWVEGGTEIARISDNWWKLQLTNDLIKIEKGGL